MIPPLPGLDPVPASEHGSPLSGDPPPAPPLDEPPLWCVRRWAFGPTVVDLAVVGAIGLAAFHVAVPLVLLIPAAWALRRHARTNATGLALWCTVWTGLVAVATLVVPGFEEIFRDIGATLPVLTVWLLHAKAFFFEHPPTGVPALLIAGYTSAGLIAWHPNRLCQFIREPVLILAAFALIGWVVAALFLPLLTTHCVVAGTPISTPDGLRPIEALAVGDSVIVREDGGALGVGRVARIRRARADAHLELRLADGTSLQVTGVHPIATTRGWIRADALQPGDVVRQLDGWCALQAIERRSGPVDVVDLTIDGAPNFHAAGVLVHNKLG